MRTSVCFLSIFFVLSCSNDARPSGTNLPEKGAYRYLAMGDSFTRGEGVPDRLSWPMQLVNLVRASEFAVSDPVLLAENGWSAGELMSAIERQRPPEAFDLVTLQIGVVDGLDGTTNDEFRERFRPLLESAVGFAGDRPRRVVVLSLPDWSATPFARGQDRPRLEERIASLNAIAREEVDDVGARWVDVSTFTRDASRHESMLLDDGLHPSGMMYAEWARLAAPQALGALRH